MTGARHSAGSTISKAGDTSPSNRVIFSGFVPSPHDPGSGSNDSAVRRLLCVVIVRNHNHSAKRKDVIHAGTCLNPAGKEAGMVATASIDSERVRVHKEPAARAARVKIFTRNLPSVG